MNLYGYAGADPVNHSDPFGLCSQIEWTKCKIFSFSLGVRFGLGVEGNVLGAKVKLNSASAGASGSISMGTNGITSSADARVTMGSLDINLGSFVKINKDFGTCSTSSGCEESASATAGAGGTSIDDHGDISAGATLGVVKVGAKFHASNTVTAVAGAAKWLFRKASDAVQVGKQSDDH